MSGGDVSFFIEKKKKKKRTKVNKTKTNSIKSTKQIRHDENNSVRKQQQQLKENCGKFIEKRHQFVNTFAVIICYGIKMHF